MRISRIQRAVIGLAILAALLWLADPARVIDTLAGISWPGLALAAAAIAVSTLIGAANLYLFVGRDQRIAWRQFVPVYWTGWAVGLVVPGQVGDIGSIALLLRRFNFDWHQSLGPAGLDKLISFAVVATLGMTGCLSALRNGPPGAAAIAIVLIACAGGYLALRRYAEPWSTRAGMLGVVGRSLRELEQTARMHPRRVAANLVLTLVKTLLIGLAYWSTFVALQVPAPDYVMTTLLMAAAGLVAYVPISLNGVGTVEAAGCLLFGQMGISAPKVLAAYLLLRIVVLTLAWAPVLLLGLRSDPSFSSNRP